MNKIILIIFFLISTFNIKYCFSEERIIFSINNESYTTIDIENKINYLLLVNKLEKNKENFNKIKLKAKESLIDDLLINELIKDKNIQILENDINTTYNNMIGFLSKSNNEIFLKMINNYDLTLEYIKNEITKEISKEIIKQILIEEINVDPIFIKNINYENFIKYKINNITLYGDNLSENDYSVQKNEILEIFKDNNFNNALNIIISKEFNISFYQQKIIHLESINKELNNLIENAKIKTPFIYESNKKLYIIEKVEVIEPDIEFKYSFIQLTSENKNNLTKYKNNNNICEKENIIKLKEIKDINAKYYENISRKKLNNNIFDKLNNQNNYVLITSANLNTLIIICNKTYSNKELEEYAINQKYMNEIDIKYQELLSNLKTRYNYTIY